MCLSAEEVLAEGKTEALCDLAELVVVDGVDSGKVSGEHIELCSLLNGFDKTERLVNILAASVNAVETPNNKTELLHLLSGSHTDLVGAAEHPGKNADTVGESYHTFGAHLPERE